MSGHKGKENFLALFKVQVAVCGLSVLNVVVAIVMHSVTGCLCSACVPQKITI